MRLSRPMFAPEVNLYRLHGDQDVVATHYAGPTWKYLNDGSTVVGLKVAAHPIPGAILELLLSAASHTGPG